MSLQGSRLSLRASLVDLVASPMPVPVRAVTLHAVLPCREHPLVLQPGFSFFHSLPEIHQGACLKAESKTEDRDKSTDFDVERGAVELNQDASSVGKEEQKKTKKTTHRRKPR